ncbi:reverse transcriptase domain-containing protein [Trichonephila clavipes]|nr:reverse transcriptase domain-containing protein [Trichonephila clavipes]
MFGVNVSPFLLSATIKHHIENYREQYPAATEMLDTCLYVDDVISGADDISQALKVSKDAETIMKNASMKLRKWNSNDQTLMRTWKREGLETHPRHPDDSSKIPLRQRFWGYHGMLSTTILQLMLKDFCNWTRQNPSQKNCASISWENIRSSWVLVTLHD